VEKLALSIEQQQQQHDLFNDRLSTTTQVSQYWYCSGPRGGVAA